MGFREKYPVPLNELLLAPVIVHESLPPLARCPFPSGALLREPAAFGGHSDGAIRTAMSRLRASGLVDTVLDDGVTRYRLTDRSRSVSHTVQQRMTRPEGFVLAIFSFASENTRERHVVRDALKLYGFQKLAQNAYINGQIDTTELTRSLKADGLADNVYLFRCPDVDDPALRDRLTGLFDVVGRKQVLARFQRDLVAFLDIDRLDDDEFAVRYLYTGPVHYRITFAEEPPLPARYLPADYPLEEVSAVMSLAARKRSRALVQYFSRDRGG